MPRKHPTPHRSAPKKKPRKKLLLESIEDRILCSATVAPAAVPENPDPAAATAAVAATVDPVSLASQAEGAALAPAALPPAAATAAGPQLSTAATQSVEVVFVDTSVPGYQALLAGMRPDVQVVLLNGGQDGLQQIAETLAGRQGIDAIHLISHGSEASLTLGSTTLTTENMQGQYASILRTIGQSLSADGDLLVYGCNFGKGADGLVASGTLARITGADVAASTTPTGNTSLGGDWILEAQTGPVAAGVVVGASAQQLWSGLLAPPPVQFFYVPMPEQAMLASMQGINGGVNGTAGMDSIITITTTENNTILYYDQWENGYETNLGVPTQTTGTARTQIWGDGDATNGATPGAAPGTDPAINAGTIITMRNTVPVPRVAANVFFDGGDKIGASKTISISRAQIPLPTGSVISSAVEVRDTRYFGTSFISPVGSNTPRPGGVGTLYSDNFLYVMASQDNTTVQIDADNNGLFEQTVVLNEGQNLVSTTNVLQGGRVVANKPVQTNLYTGNDAASYATRSYSLLPNAQLTNDYFTPVGDSGDDVVLFVYNPNAAAITVSFETRTTSGTLPAIAPGTSQFFVVPADTGTRLFTVGGQPFAAVGAHDTNGVGSAHDWGFSLQPTANLSQFAVVGLGVGNSTNPPSGGGINVSPVWVTPLAATTLYVDNDGNPATGLFLDAVTGTRYDQSFALARLQTQRVTDTTGGDQDNSGMRLFTNDGTLISTAWGEDTAAPAGSPGFDAGTTVPALPVPEFYKIVDFAAGGDTNGDGYFNSGDTLRYTLRVRNIGTQPVSNAAITDALPTSLVTYVNGSTFIDQGSGAVAIPDGGVTTFPLDETGFTILNMSAGNTTTITFDVTVNSALASGLTEIYNTGRLAYQIYNIPAVNSASLRGTVTGTAYVDGNNDGDQDAGELGIAGVTMTLTGTDIFGAAVSKVATTDSLGRYSFTDLKESNVAGYTVTQTQPTGYADGLDARGGTVIPGSGGGPNAVTGIVVIPGENDTNNNFGELGATLGGTVYRDLNNNGTIQGGETGIQFVTVTLTGTDIAGNAVNVSVLTDASGNYNFTSLRQSNAAGYTITQTQPAGFLDGLNTAGTAGGVAGNPPPGDAITGVVLGSNATATGYLFGELVPSSLSGAVYRDLNNDGLINGADTTINGVTVTLTGTNDLGAITPVVVTTAGAGAYSFTNLRPGTYTITETQPGGLLDGRETLGSQASGTVNNAIDNNTIATITLAQNVNGTGNNFGELPPASLAATVYRDLNNDGITQGGETGIQTVTVTLTGTNDRGVAVNTPLTTDASGNVNFTNLRPGTYTITETQPGGFNDGLDSNGTPAGTVTNDVISAIALTAGTTGTGYRFGELPPSSIAGTVYRDLNNNGTIQGGETGIQTVTVTLTGTNDLGAAVSLTTTTDAGGNYLFSNLRPSNATGYTITETQPVGFLDGLNTVGTSGGVAGNPPPGDAITGVVLTANTTAIGYHFGELPPSSLAGTVYRDNDNSGTINVGELGIDGVTVTLTGVNDLGVAVSVSTVTAGGGLYSFANLRPSNAGGYTLTETQPGAFLDGRDTAGTAGGSAAAVPGDAISGIVLSPNTTGATYLFGELNPASLSGFVYSDTSNFGVKDAFESAVPGATLTLTGTNDLGAIAPIVVTTNAAGAYSFTNLRPGTYTITETQPAGYADGADTLGTGLTAPNNAGSAAISDIFSGIVLSTVITGNNTGVNYNFGESPNFGLTKSLQATSVAGTTGSNLVIGETATFRLVVTMPAGGFTNFQVQDALPAGFQYVNGSAVAALVSSAGQLTSSTLSGAGLAQTSVGTPTFVMPDAAVSDNATTNSDTYASGTDVFFKLGDLTNTETTAAVESVVIEFQAVVVNEVANQAATPLANTFSVLFDKDGVGGPEPDGGSSPPVNTTVVEPVLGVTKAVAVSGTDAGDAVQYTITITNAGANAATAYDINLTDVLASTLTFGSVSVSGAAIIGDTTVGNNVNIVLDAIAAGSSATVTINATVASTAPAGSTVGNSTNIAWTSTPGGTVGERTGGGGIDDYTDSATSGTFTLARPTVDKLTPGDTTYSIGETVTYDILVTVPEGSTQALAITDNLPAGLDFESVAVQTAAGGVLANAFAGSVPAPVTTNVGNSYTFTFGNTSATGDNDATNNSFLVRVTGRIANVAGNQNAVTLTNTATLAYNDGTLGASTVTDPTPNVDITVVEPVLTLDKSNVGTSTGLDAGDTVQYQIVITNTGTAAANEVTLNDALPAGLLVTTIDSTTPAGGATIDAATSGTGTATLSGEYTIPVGGSITILYTATLQSSVTPNTNFINTATVTYTSVDGTALGQGTATGERNGSGGTNDYVLTDTAQVSTGGVLTVAKSVNDSTPVIGDVLTYTVTLTLNEGTTTGIVVTDTLPASGDLQFVAGSAAVTFGTGGSTISGSATPAVSGANSNILTFTLGSAIVPAGAGANTVVLTYQVLVANVTTNQAGDVESNSAAVVATGLTSPPPGTTSVTLREPNVTFTKAADVTSNVDAGDVITYTVTLTNPGGANSATAFDSLLADTMPANLLVTGITSTTLTGGATVDSAATITGGGAGITGQFDIPVGATVTIVYTGTVQAGFPPNSSVTNAAVLTWTSKDGGNSTAPDANERFGAGGSTFGDGSLNDYRRTTSVTSTGAAPTFNKTLFSTSDANTTGGDVALGEQVTYALVVTLPEGTASGFNVLDTLPPGLQLVSSSIVTTAAASNGLLTANFNGTVPAPTVTGGVADGDDVTFAFTPITTTGDNVANNNTFLILVTTVVTDVPANSGVTPQTTLPNSATFSGTGIPPTTPPPVNVTVTEPRLQIAKGVDDPTADLGQTLTYTLTITHTASSTAPAYDLIVRDAIPTGFTLNTGSISASGGTIATDSSTVSQLALTIDQFDVGGTITITYTATVGTGAALGGTDQDNNARLYWDTNAADTGTNTVLNGGTDGDNDRDFGATPAYTEAPTPAPDDLAQDTVRVTVNANTISGTVYSDTDASGTLNGVEAGVGVGVSVTISGTTFFGAPFSQTVTADPVTGIYTFTNVPRSDVTGYTITETQPGGFVDGAETAGVLGGTSSNVLNADTITGIVVPAGSTVATGYDFGELLGATISGSAYIDANNDGIFQGGETAQSGVTLTLTGTDIFGNAVSTVTATNAGGGYSFASLRPGTYTVTETQPGGLLDGQETAGGGVTTPGTVNNASVSNTIAGIVIAQGQTGTANNFGDLTPSSFSGTVYRDLNNDGVQLGAGETGVAGVTITLTGTDDLGNAVSTTATTDASGNYNFATLRPGTYTITETQPAGLLDGRETVGSQASGTIDNTTDSDVISTITLGAGVSGTGNNFGELPPASLTATVYRDVNNDGVQLGAGETGIVGATVTLTGTDDRGNAVSTALATDAGGNVSFANLRPGTYTLTETQPAAFADGLDSNGTPAGTLTNDQVAGIAVVSGTAGTGYKFGELPTTSIAGTVYRDLNNDGLIAGAGETGIAGVTVTLTGTNDLGAAVSLTTTSDASGNYTFSGLRPSNGAGYTLTETQPVGFLDGRNTVGTGSGTTVNNPTSDVISAVVLTAGEAATDYNFGELSPSSLAGVVFNDVNNDGLQQGGDNAISGVTVTLSGTDDLGNAVSLTTTTNGSGAYSFGSLRPGTYTLTETQPAGLLDGQEAAGTGTTTAGTVNNIAVSNTISGIVVGSGETGVANNFAELSPNSLAGTVYRDLDNDGVQLGAGETAISGVTIALTGTDDFGAAVSLTTLSDASGNYAFANLRPGTYTLTETQPAGLLDGRETVGSQASGTIDNTTNSNTISTIALTTGVSGIGNNFGELPASSFAGTVFIDANNDGVQLGAGETGISGATVTLTGTDDRGAAVSLSTTTDASGVYNFGTLRPGSYTITETQPVGFLDGINTAGTSGGTTVNNPLSDVISTITLAANTAATGYNFGELQGATLSGSAYLDANNDGVFQGGETAQSGVTITLTGTDDLGAAVSVSTTTNASGAYTFTNLRPGTYTLTETQPAGLLDGRETVGTQGSGTIDNTTDNNTIAGIVIASGQTGAANNFGDLTPASLAATVYLDVNNDGTQLGAGETGINGATVTLTGTDDRGNAVSTALATDASGNVSFANLRPGTYTLTETQPAGFNDGIDSNGTPAGTLTNDQVAAIAVGAGTTGTGYKFGELPTTSIAGTVYRDLNNDGLIAGAGETGIAGVTVTLTGTDDLGAAVSLTTTSDASGNYSFTGLRPSNAAGYTLTETQPVGFLDGRNTLGTGSGTTVNNPASDVISAVVLTAGDTETGYNFGELPPASFSGTVYRDLDNDGVQSGAGETGVSGATIVLTGTDDLGNAVSTTATTDVNGNYTFATLRPGTYTITETQPAGLLDGRETVGSQASGTIDNTTNSNTISTITLAANVNGTGNNFGELPPTSLAGTVFIDANNDGVQFGAGETGISGATVTLTGTDDRGAAVSLTATSDAAGAYAFSSLRPGSYVVTETQPAGFLDGQNTAGSAGGTTVNNPLSDLINAITLTANTTATGYNFGELSPSSLAGVVFNDVNNDGVQQVGDNAISGVTVTLSGTDDLGNAVSLTTTTNGSGAYSFGSLRPGTYTLTETQPAGLLDGQEAAGTGTTTAGTVNNIAVSNTISGIVVGSGETGVANNFAELSPNSLAGTVYRDLNNDGVQLGAGEIAISGVTIALTGTDDFGAAVSVTTLSDVSGNYAFANLRPGTYTLTETQPVGLLDGRETVGSQASGTIDNTTNSNTIAAITLTTGTSGAGNNFGELPASSFAGTVFIDANNDGVQLGAGETGISGATVTLTGTDDRGAAVSLSTTTDASGVYNFGTLRPGSYTITETQPVGFLDGINTAGTSGGTTVNIPPSDVISAITLNADTAATGYNFGELATTSLSGTVYTDLNNDGVQLGAGETGISGVTVTLTGTDDLGSAISISTITDGAGAYSFANIRPGTYTLTETQPAGLLDGRETAGGGVTTPGAVNNAGVSNTIVGIVVAPGQSGTANNFGELPPASLAGTVFIDVNNDGVQLGAGETGISGATVTLAGTDDFGAAVSLVAVSDAAGAYNFGTLRPGTYTVTETQPAGFLDGTNTAGSAGGTTINNPLSDVISAITLTANTSATGYNFGEIAPSSLSGTVFTDLNNDGVQLGAGETGLAGVTVTLTGTDDLGNAVNVSVLTNGSGAYTFASLRPGTYTLTETQPAGLLDGRETVGTQGSGTINNTIDSNVIATIALGTGVNGAGNNFAELPASALAGTVFVDANNDGVQLGAGETGIAGATVTLTGTDDRGAAVSLAATTLADGSYSFGTLRPGSYTLTETQPVGFLDGINAAGTSGGTTINNPPSDVISAITLVANTAATEYNFGELQGAVISGSAYVDANNDGVFQGGETALAGVTVTLTGTDDLGNAVSVSAVTLVDGSYTFSNLRPGTYTLTETQPVGLFDGRETAGGGVSVAGTVDNTIDSNTIAGIVVTSGQTGAANNFGELAPASLAATVYRDLNNDGTQLGGGETGIAGVTVTLTGTDDRGNAVSTAIGTDAGGNVSFANLRPGSYTITEAQPVAFNDGLDSNGTPAGTLTNDQVSGIAVVSGTAGTGYRFGELPGTSISGTVYRDLNNDGLIAGAGETGIVGVTVTLTGIDDLGAAVSLTTITDASGNYTFSGLRPSDAAGYTITETQPAGLLDGRETAGGGVTTPGAVNNTGESNTIVGIVVASGQIGTANNFGELPPASLAATVYRDLNNDGTQAGVGETGIAGVTVTLTGTDDRGNAVSTAVLTNAGGNVIFANLRPGIYTIAETQPVAFNDGLDSNGAPAGTLTNDQVAGIALTADTAGTGYAFGELPTTSVSGTVYRDLDNDGLIAGAGETGIAGVTVTLTGLDDLGAAVSLTAVSDASGNYAFTGLRPSDAAGYTLTETQPAGFLDGRNTAGTSGGTTVNNPASDVISGIVLPANAGATDYNFGELPPAGLAGSVYVDANNDGTRQVTETGIVGATITLSGTDDLGAPVSLSTVTLADGSYSFGNLRPGSYAITETQPAGFLDGQDVTGTLGGTLANDSVSAITVVAADAGADYNFGELRPSSLSGTVFDDRNNDGVINVGESGVGGVTITLSGIDDLGAPVSTTTVTLADGSYSFSNLRPGTYQIAETQPAGLLDGIDTVGTQGGTLGNDVLSAITIAEGTAGSANNFGELTPAGLAGSAYVDANNDGIRQVTETGIAGAVITLSGTDDLGAPVSLGAVTLADGSYSFGNLRPGSYAVNETQPAGFLDGKDATGTLGGTLANDNVSAISIPPAAAGASYSFGELLAASIGGSVFQDFNLDGSRNGPDSGIGGVTVTLTGTDDLGAPVSVVATTLPDGSYSFGNLRPGTYAITETQPAGFGDGIDTAGSAGGLNTANDLIGGIILGSGSTGTGYTFAETFLFDPTKSIVSTSNPGTSAANLSIGEIVRYQLVVALPDGTLPSAALQDQLPAGLVFLDDGTAAVSLVSLSGSGVTSSTLAGAGLGGTNQFANPTFALPGSAISSSLTSDVDVYGSGTDVFFKLGDLTNTETNVAGGQFAVIEFNARVENIQANRLGAPLDNTFRLLFDLNGDGTPDVPPVDIVSNPARAIVAEPVLFLDKQLVSGSATPSQNDILTFTVTIGHATGSNATAWESAFSDVLPKGLQLESITTGATGGAVITQAATSDAQGVLRGQFDIPVGGQIVITYQVKVNVGSGNGAALVNGADVTWTSMPGDSPVERHAGDSLYGRGGLQDYEVRDEVAVRPFTFAFDSFQNFAWAARPGSNYNGISSPDIYRQPLLPLAPIYSGEADPGSTLVLTLYNTKGDIIGTQTVVVDAGGNWMATFPNTVIRDYPNSVQISQSAVFYSLSDPHGYNLRTYYSPALNAGHFMFQELRMIDKGGSTPLLGDLGIRNPLRLGTVKFGGELLAAPGVPGGY